MVSFYQNHSIKTILSRIDSLLRFKPITRYRQSKLNIFIVQCVCLFGACADVYCVTVAMHGFYLKTCLHRCSIHTNRILKISQYIVFVCTRNKCTNNSLFIMHMPNYIKVYCTCHGSKSECGCIYMENKQQIWF